VASGFYNLYKKKLFNGLNPVDLDTDTIKVALVTSSYTVDFDTHDFFDDITNEVSGTGYTAGGATLANPVVALNTSTDTANFDADDTSWTTATITARAAVVYKSTGTASTSPLIAYFDFTSDKVSTAGTFLITWAAGGLFTVV
jgi:hypothetical protein